MNIRINFHQMPHSDGLDHHARTKVEKVSDFFKSTEPAHPIHAEFFLNAHATHAAHAVELRVTSGAISVVSHESHPDMYLAIDAAVDKAIAQLKKEKAKLVDKRHKVETEKKAFGS